MARTQVIAIIGTSRDVDPAVTHARELGRLIAASSRVLVTGGRDAGVMRAANEGAKEAGGLTIGILPDRETRVSPYVDVAIITGTGEAGIILLFYRPTSWSRAELTIRERPREVALALKAGKPVILVGDGENACDFFRKIGGGGIQTADSPKLRFSESMKCYEDLPPVRLPHPGSQYVPGLLPHFRRGHSLCRLPTDRLS